MLQKCSLEQYLELVKKNYFDSNHQPTVDSMQSYTSIAKFIIFFRRRAQKSAMASECRTSTCCATRPTPACGSTSAIAPTWCSRRRWTSTLSHRSLNKVSWTKPLPPPQKKKSTFRFFWIVFSSQGVFLVRANRRWFFFHRHFSLGRPLVVLIGLQLVAAKLGSWNI